MASRAVSFPAKSFVLRIHLSMEVSIMWGDLAGHWRGGRMDGRAC